MSSADESQTENAASRLALSHSQAVFSQDWDTARANIAAEAVRYDHCGIGAPDAHGVDQVLANLKKFVSSGFAAIHQELLATRSDDLALLHLRFETANDYELVMLSLVELDDSGKITRVDFYDPDDEAAARADMEGR